MSPYTFCHAVAYVVYLMSTSPVLTDSCALTCVLSIGRTYENGARISAQHNALVQEVVVHHPKYTEKAGCGIAYIKVTASSTHEETSTPYSIDSAVSSVILFLFLQWGLVVCCRSLYLPTLPFNNSLLQHLLGCVTAAVAPFCFALHSTTCNLRLQSICHLLMQVDKHPNFPDSRCFWIVREDGTETDFSYHKCLKEKAAKEFPDFVEKYDTTYTGKSRGPAAAAPPPPPPPANL
jgi:hypothetical protein